jgi:hypothetical protein
MNKHLANAKKKTKQAIPPRKEVNAKDKTPRIEPAKSVYDLSTRQRLIKDVKGTIELGLQVSNWGDQKFKNKAVVVRQYQELRGRSGSKWVPDLLVLDGDKKEVYGIIYCVDANLMMSATRMLNEALTCFSDLAHLGALPLVAVKNNRRNTREERYSFRFLRKCQYLFGHFCDSSGIRAHVLEFKPKSNTKLLRLILSAIKETNPRRKGIKSISQALDILAQKYPDFFAKRLTPTRSTKCAELLRQIQEQDPSLSIGQIICESIQSYRRGRIGELETGAFLTNTKDVEFEKLLEQYLERQK